MKICLLHQTWCECHRERTRQGKLPHRLRRTGQGQRWWSACLKSFWKCCCKGNLCVVEWMERSVWEASVSDAMMWNITGLWHSFYREGHEPWITGATWTVREAYTLKILLASASMGLHVLDWQERYLYSWLYAFHVQCAKCGSRQAQRNMSYCQSHVSLYRKFNAKMEIGTPCYVDGVEPLVKGKPESHEDSKDGRRQSNSIWNLLYCSS